MSSMFKGASSFNQSLNEWDIKKVENMKEMFTNSNLSTENYDSSLEGWSYRDVQDDVKLGTSSHYCNNVYRQILIDRNNWQIDDAGEDCQ